MDIRACMCAKSQGHYTLNKNFVYSGPSQHIKCPPVHEKFKKTCWDSSLWF